MLSKLLFAGTLTGGVLNGCCALLCAALLGTITPSQSAFAAGQASAPARSASGLPARATSPGSAHRAGNRGVQTDNRSVIVESNLRSLNRSLDASRPNSPTLPAPSPCPSCGERAKVRPSAETRNAADASQRSSLHKLRRESAIKQSTDTRRTRIEASRPD